MNPNRREECNERKTKEIPDALTAQLLEQNGVCQEAGAFLSAPPCLKLANLSCTFFSAHPLSTTWKCRMCLGRKSVQQGVPRVQAAGLQVRTGH